MKSLIWLYESLLADASNLCGTDSTRDLKTIARRIEHEGDWFIHVTLPSFSSALEIGLEEGRWPGLSDFASKRKHGVRWCLPAFLQGFTSQVFEPKSGYLLDDPSTEAILAIRQICLVAKKVFKRPPPEREAKALNSYIELERSLKDEQKAEINQHSAGLRHVSRVLWSDVFGRLFQALQLGELPFRHGPGATADRKRGNSKFRHGEWFSRWDKWFFPDRDVYLNATDWVENHARLSIFSPDEEPPVKVVFVPKTQKTPRVIAMEPCMMQYMQQGLAGKLVELLEGVSHPSLGKINFTDQSVNQKLAARHSKDQRLATLDLSEASDRVDCKVVHAVFSACSGLREAIFSLRSTRATLPNGVTIPLRKFASMGSALCFPVESVVFYTIIIYARLLSRGLLAEALTSRTLRKLCRDVYVYGDDLIVPTDEVPIIINTLEAFGLKVNTTKSFWKGYFRESCGGDFFKGESVKPVYVRREFPNDERTVPEVVSWVATANQFYLAGWWMTAKSIRSRIESITGTLPTSGFQDVGYLHWTSVRPIRTFSRWNKFLQTYEVRGIQISPSKRKDVLNDYPALRKVIRRAYNVQAHQIDPDQTRIIRVNDLEVSDLPEGERLSSGQRVPVGTRSPLDAYSPSDWVQKDTQIFGVPSGEPEGRHVLVASFHSVVNDPIAVRHWDHVAIDRDLLRSVVRGALTLKRRWCLV